MVKLREFIANVVVFTICIVFGVIQEIEAWVTSKLK